MEAKKDNRNIFEIISVVVVMAILLIASFFFYSRVIRESYYGTVGEFLNIFSSSSGAASPANLEKKIIILEGTATAKFFEKSTSEPLSIMWSNFLKQKNVAYELISQDDFISKDLSGYDTLILPFAICLSDREIQKIKEFASDEKKGLILDGFTGSRDENGKWRETSFLSEIIGGFSFKEVKDEGEKGLVSGLILDGTSIMSSNIVPGFRLEINTYNRPVSANIVEPRIDIDAYWEPTPVLYRNKLSPGEAGIVHGKYLGARFVWLGFTMGAVAGNIEDQKVLQNLLNNIFNYVNFWPIIYKDRWPKGEKAVVLFAEDTEDRFENAANAVTLFTSKKVPCTFFCVPEMAAQYYKVFNDIYKHENFEIGLHGLDVYQGQSLEVQQERLRSGREILEKLTGKKLRGFRPPEALYDKNTLQALFNLNYDYMAGDDTKQTSPEVIQVKKTRGLSIGKNLKYIVKFPKTSNDDFDILERYKMQDKVKMLEVLKQDFDNVYKVGGLFYYSFHTQLMADDDYIDVIGKFIDYVKGKDVWIATFSEVNDWWVKWSLGVDFSSSQMSPRRTTVKVVNNSLKKVDTMKINVILPPSKKLVKAYSEKLGIAVPFAYGKDGRVIFDIQNLRVDDNLIFDIEYN